jgi:hypothetical protein
VTNNSYEERPRLTFAQAEGIEPLPTQLKRTEISAKLASLVWAVLHRELLASGYNDNLGFSRTNIVGLWAEILRDYHVYSQHRPVDEFNSEMQLPTPVFGPPRKRVRSDNTRTASARACGGIGRKDPRPFGIAE